MIISEYKFIIDNMTWSFSRLNVKCWLEFFKNYIQCEPGENSAMGEFGSLCHELLEDYLKGNISIFEISQRYEELFDERIPHEFPPNKYVNMRESYFKKGLDYFDTLDMQLDNYEILGVEKKVSFEIEGYRFIGFIDLLLRDKTNGEITVYDHKSSTIKILKNGKVSKGDLEHFEDFKRQLYLYSVAVIEEYGKVDKLTWNMYKNKEIISIPFRKDEFENAKQWALDQIHIIENKEEWEENQDYFYCANLCNQRNNCEFNPLNQNKEEEYGDCYF